MTVSPLAPYDVARFADDIAATDPHFSGLLPTGHTLASALEADLLAPATLQAIVTRARDVRGMNLEQSIDSLLREAYQMCTGYEASEAWMAGLRRRYGVGEAPTTLQRAAELVGVTRERVRQVGVKVEPHLRGAWCPALLPVLKLLVEHSPVPQPVGALLAEAGLGSEGLTADSIVMFVRLLGVDVCELVGTDLKVVDGWMVDVREESITGAVRIASKHTSTFGMTTVEDIRQELSTPEAPADIDDVRRVLHADGRVRWAGDWVWVDRDDNSRANSMVNHVRSMLSVNSPQSVTSLREGVHRAWKFRRRDIVPAVAAMTTFLKASDEFVVIDEGVELAEPLDYHDVQGDVASLMIDVIKASSYGVMDRATLTQACTDVGISASTAGVWCTYSEWMEQFAVNVWGLRGSHPSPAVVEEVRRAATARHQSEPHAAAWAWNPAGQIVLTMDVTTSARTSGVFAFDTTLGQTVGDRRLKMVVDGVVAGELRISASHLFTWGWGKAFVATGAKVGDVLAVTLDLDASVATVVKGDRSLW